jgi:hypothetical protein
MRQADRPLTPGWVAGSVRARHMLARRVGRGPATALATSASLEDALAILSGSAYGRFVRPGIDLGTAQRAIAETVLWNVRVMSGWTPPGALEPVRALAAWFELVNLEDRLAYLAGGELPTPFVLGGLGAAWSHVAGVQSAAELRAALAGSPWGDPGGDDAAGIRLGLRLAWARRVLRSVEEAGAWAAGAVALLVARELFLAHHEAGDLLARRPPGVGVAWAGPGDVAALREVLPPSAAWVLRDVEDTAGLWRAEVAWWRQVEEDATRLAGQPMLGRGAVIGTVVLLGVDAWRVAGALEAAARGGGPAAMEVFREIA